MAPIVSAVKRHGIGIILGVLIGWLISDTVNIVNVSQLHRRMESIVTEVRDDYEAICRVDSLTFPKFLLDDDKNRITDFVKMRNDVKDIHEYVASLRNGNPTLEETRAACRSAIEKADEALSGVVEISQQLNAIEAKANNVLEKQTAISADLKIEVDCPGEIGCDPEQNDTLGSYLTTALNAVGTITTDTRKFITDPGEESPIAVLRTQVQTTGQRIESTTEHLKAVSIDLINLTDQVKRHTVKGYGLDELTIVTDGNDVKLKFELPKDAENCTEVSAVIIPRGGETINTAMTAELLFPDGKFCSGDFEMPRIGETNVAPISTGQSVDILVFLKNPDPFTDSVVGK